VVFSSPIFLFLFLPITLTVSLLLPGVRLKNLWLLCVSLVFYAWGETLFVLLIFISTLLNYGLGLWIDATDGKVRRQRVVAAAVALNLGLLVFFKYGNFAVENLNALLGVLKLKPVQVDRVRLPIGISFFTFHALSYIIDVYRGKVRAARKPSDLALYIFFFPQLIAGPILRWSAMAPQIAQRVVTREGFWEGVRRFVYGLAKKTLLANTLAVPADRVFSLPPEALSGSVAWTGTICYTLQIYFDFSGYSDMAIGLGRMFGFEFMENFRYPYVAQSIKDFWRRWHISLATWFRDYLYFPLGGNRCSPGRQYANLLLVFLLCGLWHGASWTFVIWGLYHGLFLVLERTRFGGWLERVPRLLRHGYALAVVMAGWVIFRAESAGQAAGLLRNLFDFSGATNAGKLHAVIFSVLGAFVPGEEAVFDLMTMNRFLGLTLTRQVVWAALAGILFAMPVGAWLRAELLRLSPAAFRPTLRFGRAFAESVLLLALLVASAAFLADGTYNPFIYFRF
jgi:alginate O-acetyltransferase complex protein AlgI